MNLDIEIFLLFSPLNIVSLMIVVLIRDIYISNNCYMNILYRSFHTKNKKNKRNDRVCSFVTVTLLNFNLMENYT